MHKPSIKTDEKKSILDNIFIPSDEAFALKSLHSDYNLWINTTQGQRKRKTFTDSESGNGEEGWSAQGQILYKNVLDEVKK
eukprot:jgi/Psemu1/24223/gm1.24223_g